MTMPLLPLLQAARFRSHKVAALLKGLLKERLEGQVYDPVRGSQMTKQLAGEQQGLGTGAAHLPGCLAAVLQTGACIPAQPAPGSLPADDIRERVKALGFDRHKLVVHVTVGERRWQTFSSCSRCLWDTATDGFASQSYQNESLFCSAQVFALYFE